MTVLNSLPFNRLEAPAEEFKAAAQGLVAQFGTWSVNDTDKTMTRHIEGALFPNIEGTDDSTSFSLAGDELKLTNNQPTGGGKLESVYRRDALGAARTPETFARARLEARIAALHSGLQLTPEQESRWPTFEQAYRELAKLRIEPGGEPPAVDDPVARMERRADDLTRRGAAVKALAEAVAPLWQSFSGVQKRRFAALARPFNFRLEFGARDERGGFGSDRDRYGFGRGPRDFAPDGPGRDGDLRPRGSGPEAQAAKTIMVAGRGVLVRRAVAATVTATATGSGRSGGLASGASMAPAATTITATASAGASGAGAATTITVAGHGVLDRRVVAATVTATATGSGRSGGLASGASMAPAATTITATASAGASGARAPDATTIDHAYGCRRAKGQKFGLQSNP